MSYALAALAAVVGSVQAVPPAISSYTWLTDDDDVIDTTGIPIASADFSALGAPFSLADAAGNDADGSSFVVSNDAAELLIASDSLLVLAHHHNVNYVDGHIIITIPNKYLNDASKILDLVYTEITGLSELVNVLIGNHRLPTFEDDQVQSLVDRVSGPATLVHEALLAATHVVRQFSIKFETPANLTKTASDPTCDGVCLLLKANKIITELTTLTSYLAGKVGLDPVFALVKPIIDAAEALVLELDGDLPDFDDPSDYAPGDSSSSSHHHRFTAPFHRLHNCVMRRIHLLGFKLAWFTAKKYLHHAIESESNGACHTCLSNDDIAGLGKRDISDSCDLGSYGYGSYDVGDSGDHGQDGGPW